MNPAEPPRGFPKAEYEARLERAQRSMREDGLDALLLMSEPDVRYFSGFVTPLWQSPTRPWFLIVPAARKPIAVIPEIGAPLMLRTWLEDVRTWPAPRPEDDGVSLLLDALRGIGAGAGRVGLLTGPETALRMPLADYHRLRDALPHARFMDATGLVRSLRLAKSEREIAKIGYACEVASTAFASVPELAFAGQPLAETFRAFRIALLRAGADDVAYLAGGAGPGGYPDVISPPSGRLLQDGDVLVLDTGAVHDGYFCDHDRNYAIGRVDDTVLRAYDTLYRATEAGLRAAHPGSTCTDLFHAMRAVIEADGHEADPFGRMGHGLGMQLTEWPSIRTGDATVLSQGMVLTLEPGLTLGSGRCMVHEEDIVIRDDGAHLLSRRAAPSLPVAG